MMCGESLGRRGVGSGGKASVGAVDSFGDAHSERRSRRTKRLIRTRGVGSRGGRRYGPERKRVVQGRDAR